MKVSTFPSCLPCLINLPCIDRMVGWFFILGLFSESLTSITSIYVIDTKSKNFNSRFFIMILGSYNVQLKTHTFQSSLEITQNPIKIIESCKLLILLIIFVNSDFAQGGWDSCDLRGFPVYIILSTGFRRTLAFFVKKFHFFKKNFLESRSIELSPKPRRQLHQAILAQALPF